MLKPVLTFKIKFYNADISRQKNCVYKIEHEVFKNMNIFSLTLCCHTSTEQPQIVSILPLVPHLPSFISRTSKCGEKKKKQFRFLCHTINEVSTPSCKLFKTCQDRMIALLWNCSCACFSYDLKQFLIKAIIAILKKSNQIIYDQFRNFISIRKQKEWLITHLTKMKFHL